jgi:5'-3' exonuclease
MGIKGLNDLIHKRAPNAYFTISIKAFFGKRIAIDANNWMYTNMSIARKKVLARTGILYSDPHPDDVRKEWITSVLNFIITWIGYQITPIFVFDGIHPPEKEATKMKRKNVRLSSIHKIEQLREQLKENSTPELLEQLRKELRNINYISIDDFTFFRSLIQDLGIPCFDAPGDGEQLCCAMALDGRVAGVFSADTDNLVYGCPLVITKFNFKSSVPQLECIRLDRVLSGLNIDHATFVDLCIMAGCDFNTNIPNYAVVKSLKLLEEYHSIDNLPATLNIECLNHHRCRTIFSYKPTDASANYNITTINPKILTPLTSLGLAHYIHRIRSLYLTMNPGSDGSISFDPVTLTKPAIRLIINY